MSLSAGALPLVLLAVLSHSQVAMAQPAGGFAATGNMITSRGAHTATLLLNGKVLVTGGYKAGSPLVAVASAELYDSSTGTFAITGNMTVARVGHSATLLADGRVLIVGGIIGLSSAELFDPSTGTFTATGDLVRPPGIHKTALLGNGKVLIAGETAQLYDPATGSFALTGTYAHAGPLLVETSTLLADGKVLVTAYGSTPTNELYDPVSGTFSIVGSTTGPENWWWQNVNTATLLTNGKVLIVGNAENDGYPGVAEMYDHSTAVFSNIGNTTAPHEFSTATLLPDGMVLIAGGQLPGGNGDAGADLYSPASGRFSSAPGMVTARHNHTATLLLDGTVLIAGGFRIWPVPTANAEIYTPPEPKAGPVLLSLSGDGRGQGAIQHAGTVRIASATDPAVAGEYLSIYLTGLADGSVIPPQVAIGGRLAEVTFFGNVPGYPGLNVVNLRMPSGAGAGSAVPVRFIYLGRPSNEVTIGVR